MSQPIFQRKIAISHDGALVAAGKMRQTALSKRSPRDASVMLISFNAKTGALTPLDRRESPGVLPEGAAFDRAGRKILVTALERCDRVGGAIHVLDMEGVGAAARLACRGIVETPQGVTTL